MISQYFYCISAIIKDLEISNAAGFMPAAQINNIQLFSVS